jgi:hypothetical protein
MLERSREGGDESLASLQAKATDMPQKMVSIRLLKNPSVFIIREASRGS